MTQAETGAATAETPYRRLHPSSWVFLLAVKVRSLIIPVAVYVFAGEGSMLRFLLLIFLVPSALEPLLRYVTYRYQLRPGDMVVREGLLFRNERRIPYSRIHNVDLLQNPFHRLLGVHVVRLETASGGKPEAVIRVLSQQAIGELREQIATAGSVPLPVLGDSSSEQDDPDQAAAVESKAGDGRALLRLPPIELVKIGLISNQGMVVIGAAIALAFQQNWVGWDRLGDGAPWETWELPLLPELESLRLGWLVGFALIVGGLLAALTVIYLFSIALACYRFYGFTLALYGDQLRTELGLFTRVSQSTPRGRIQCLQVQRSWRHRLLDRASLRIDTAGGGGGPPSGSWQPGEDSGGVSRQWLAPLVATGAVPELMRAALPAVEVPSEGWQPIAWRAWRRRFRRSTALLLVVTAAASWLSLWGLLIAVLGLPVAFFLARRYVGSRELCCTAEAILWRSGWWNRQLAVVPFNKIQTVVLAQSPFDRRHRMATVRIDTAGASKVGHAISIPYLDRGLAQQLADRLHAETAGRAFRWG